MANIMNQVAMRNHVSRNGFDLSYKNNFTSKVGEILPVFCKPVIPGDKFRISVKSFTRLQPINSAAFARMREYYDFYFVPMEMLWNKWDSVASQMKDNLQHASSFNPKENVAPTGDFPYVTSEQLANYVHALATSSYKNEVGFDRALCTCKLLEYLGYGSFYEYCKSDVDYSTKPMSRNLRYSILPLLAYQKVYYDHFRYSQWEKSNPNCFNVDFLNGVDDLNINLADVNFPVVSNFLDLRYCNFNKDLFLGVLPNSQYGDMSSIDTTNVGDFVPFKLTNTTTGVPLYQGTLETVEQVSQPDLTTVRTKSSIGIPSLASLYVKDLLGKFSILQLRQAEALQKYKEIAQSVSEDYKSQIEAHFGVSVSDYLSHICKYLGGTAGNLDINSVVNTNITGDNQADLAGVGTIQNNGVIEFDSGGQYGYIVGVYHCLPLFDYCCAGVDPVTTQANILDLPLPEFDQIGMELVPSYKLLNPIKTDDGTSDQHFAYEFSQVCDYLGYAPRYVDFKTSVDVARGEFNNSLKNWVIPFDFNRIRDYWTTAVDSGHYYEANANSQVPSDLKKSICYAFFKVSPSVMDSLFAVAANSSLNTDQMLNSVFFDVKAVRNLDTNGLPY